MFLLFFFFFSAFGLVSWPCVWDLALLLPEIVHKENSTTIVSLTECVWVCIRVSFSYSLSLCVCIKCYYVVDKYVSCSLLHSTARHIAEKKSIKPNEIFKLNSLESLFQRDCGRDKSQTERRNSTSFPSFRFLFHSMLLIFSVCLCLCENSLSSLCCCTFMFLTLFVLFTLQQLFTFFWSWIAKQEKRKKTSCAANSVVI